MLVAALALARGDGSWLMQRRPEGKAHAGQWEFPGGKVEPGETARAALVREIAEELGITISESDLEPVEFAESFPSDDRPSIVILLYTSQRWTGEPVALEGGAWAWLTPDKIVQLDLPPLDRELCRRLFPQS